MIAAFTLNISIDRRYVVSQSRQAAVNRVKECTYTAGGKGLNVARVLHALGYPVLAGGIAGGDAGRYVLRRLDEEGISHRFTVASDESRSCINIYDEATGTQTEYLEPGAFISAAEYQSFLRDFDEIAAQCSFMTLSGSLPRGISSDAYEHLIRRAAKADCKAILDTSGEALARGLAGNPYLIKPNEEELVALTQCDANDEAQMAQAAYSLIARGAQQVVVSRGSRGAMLVTKAGVFRGTAPRIKAVNTVGCGDSMMAAFAAAFCDGKSSQEALAYGIAVSAAAALTTGTGSVRLEDVQAIASQVRIDSL